VGVVGKSHARRYWLRSVSALIGATLVGGAFLVWAGSPWWVAVAMNAASVSTAVVLAIGDALNVRQERAELAERLDDREPPPGVTALLSAERAVVPFVGREQESARLLAWCEDAEAGPVCLLTGPGGVGKTRLARQFVRRLEAEKPGRWRCVVVKPKREGDAVEVMRAVTGRRLLLVVDYAETRAQLSRLLLSVAEIEDRSSVRVLLIARSAGEWWETLAADDRAVRGLLGPAALRLRLGTDLGTDATTLANRAVPHFAEELGLSGVPRPRVRLPDGQLPLLVVQIAALVSVLRQAQESASVEQLPQDVRGLQARILEELIDRESHRWLGSRPLALAGSSMATLRSIVALLCLSTPVDLEDAAERLSRVPELRDAGIAARRETARWLRQLYPPGPDEAGWWSTMGPDLVAEYAVCRTLATDPGLVDTFFAQLDEATARQALTLLARAAEHRPEAVTVIRHALLAHFGELVGAALAVAVETGTIGSVLPELLPELDLPPERLIALYEALPSPTTTLAGMAVAVTERIIGSPAADSHAAPAQRSEWLAAYGKALAADGRLADALAATEEAAGIHRRLSQSSDDDLAGLADILTDLGVRLSELGRPGEALPVTLEAVTHHRAIERRRPQERAFALAEVLNDLGVRYQELGLWEESLEPTREAIGRFRELSAADDDRALFGLGASLSNLGVSYQGLGERLRAIGCEQEAVAIFRDLAAKDPDRYLPDLAWSLSALSIRLSQLARWQEALETESEALAVWRVLAEHAPRRHGPSLARSLTHLGRRLADVGRFDEALDPSEEAVVMRRAQVKENQAAPGELAMALAALSDRLAETGRCERALAVLDEALSLQSALVAVNPGRHRNALARDYSRRATRLVEVGRTREALTSARTAVVLLRELVESNRARNLDGLAGALAALSLGIRALGHPQWAVAPAEEAVTYYRELEDDVPGTYSRELTSALENLAELRRSLRHRD
jgi:tetratricopeptide (TPR) repeat protein